MAFKLLFKHVVLLGSCVGFACCESSYQADTDADQAVVDTDTTLLLSQSDSLFLLAKHYRSVSKYDSAIYLCQESLRLSRELFQDTTLVEIYTELGSIYQDLFKLRYADEYYEIAKQLAERNLAESPAQLVELYLSIANCKRELFSYEEARANIRKAEAVMDKEFPGDDNLIGRINLSLGNILYNEMQYDLAIPSYEKSIYHFKQIYRYTSVAIALLNISVIYSNQSKYDTALRYVNQSLRYARLSNHEESEAIAGRVLLKARILKDIGEYDSAEFYYRKVIAIRSALYDVKDYRIFGARAGFASYWLERGQVDSAAYYFHQSLNSYIKDFNDTAFTSIPTPGHSEIHKDLAWALTEKAKVLALLDHQNNNPEFLRSSIRYLRLADSVLSVYRRYFLFEDQQFKVLQSGETVYQLGHEIPYEAGLECVLKLFEQTGDEEYLDDAIYFMENSRAKRLSEVLALAEAFNAVGVPREILQQRNELYRVRAETLQSYQAGASDSLDLELAGLSEQINLIDAQLNEINPNYSTTRHEQALPKLSELKSIAGKRDAVLIEYYWSDSTLYVLIIDKAEVAFRKIDLTEDFFTALDGVLKNLASPSGDFLNKAVYRRFVSNAAYLYRVLLPDLAGKSVTSRLVVSPHGRLSFLPFEMLVEFIPDTTEVNYKLPYVLHRYSVSYVQALHLLTRHRSVPSDGTKVLAMGFSTLSQGTSGVSRNGLQGLPGTEQEISSIREVMKDRDNAYFVGPEASETTLKREAQQYNILHLAVHGESDPSHALNSRLMFRNDQDSLNDGNLYAHELYDMDLRNTSLVVLSACESGIGKPQPGEGLLSISRGFAYAGCQSQIISLWRIDDRTSAQVMRSFYKRLSDGNDVDMALAQAKLTYLANANEFKAHPSYWAAFLQVGNQRALKAARPAVFTWVVAFVILVIVSAIAYKWITRHH
jgi:CHAT domain-containing protein